MIDARRPSTNARRRPMINARRRRRLCAALGIATAFQVVSCQENLALLGLRTAFSSLTLPINEFIRQFFLSLI
jgi:hypothetical protein